MSDIAILFEDLTADFKVQNNDLLTEDGLYSAVIVSLFSDRRASPTDPLPDGETKRRGWWGDDLATDPLQKTGSLLWLVQREKVTREVLLRAEKYVRDALQWFIDEGIASSVTVSGEFTANSSLILTAKIYRGPNKRYQYLWDGLKSLENIFAFGQNEMNIEFI